MNLRKCHEGISCVSKDDYPYLPEELDEFSFYYDDGETGHVIMAIPECVLDEALEDGNLDIYEIPIPVKYVLSKGYRIVKEHIVCDADYDESFGLDIGEEWYEL